MKKVLIFGGVITSFLFFLFLNISFASNCASSLAEISDDGNPQFNSSDISFLEKKFISGADFESRFDLNLDGRFTLADIVSSIQCYVGLWDWDPFSNNSRVGDKSGDDKNSEIISDKEIITSFDVREDSGIDRDNEMISNGIPLARQSKIYSTENIHITDSLGKVIPATFEVLSRWAGGKDDQDKKIQWVLVSFPASVTANGTEKFYLRRGKYDVFDEIISVSETDDAYFVDTGNTEFEISKSELSIFEAVYRNGKKVLEDDGFSSSKLASQDTALAKNPKRFVVERKNEHLFILKVEGDYDNDLIGNKVAAPLSYKLRYEFHAGSPTVILHHKFSWLGMTDHIASGATVTVDNVKLSFPSMQNYLSTEIYAKDKNLKGVLSSKQRASIQQFLRDPFDKPYLARLSLSGETEDLDFAERAIFVNRGSNASVAVGIDHMEYFEPQSITGDSSGKIDVNVLAQNQYLSNFQGGWAKVAVSFLDKDVSYDKVLSENYASLNDRLFAFPDNEYVSETGVFLDLATRDDLESNLKTNKYLKDLERLIDTTKNWLENEKYRGLMTWGSLTRYPKNYSGSWPNYSGETGRVTSWSKVYSGAKHADYHNSWNNVIFDYVYSRDPGLLYTYAFMGARRMLNTQIIQPDDKLSSKTQMGWGFSGYEAYRKDGNSCHSYFDNLFAYYYLTGDLEVVDILKVAGNTKKHWYTRENDNSLSDLSDDGVSWIDFVSRPASQTASYFNFLGHVYDDDYLDDFKYIYSHAFTTSLVLLKNNEGKEYAFVSKNKDIKSGFRTEQFWMKSLYFMHNLSLIYNEWGDLELGADKIKISRVMKGLAYGMKDFSAQTDGEDVWLNTWANSAIVNFTGNRIGGALQSVEISDVSGDGQIYPSDKSSLVTAILKAGIVSEDSELVNFGKEGFSWLVGDVLEGAVIQALGKENGLLFARIHYAAKYFLDN